MTTVITLEINTQTESGNSIIENVLLAIDLDIPQTKDVKIRFFTWYIIKYFQTPIRLF